MPGPVSQKDLNHVLAHTQDVWKELNGGRIFITGGTGFFGSWLLETFCHANSELSLNARSVVLTRNAEAFHKKMPHLASRSDLEFLEGDVRNFPFPGGGFTHTVHAATSLDASVPDEETLDTIVNGTRRVLEFAHARGVRKLLLTSSGAVCGKQPPDITKIPEDYPGTPPRTDSDSAYAEGKRAAELLCTTYSQTHGIETKIARGFAFVGPCMPLNAHFAMGNFLRDAMAGGPITVKNGAPLRSYLYAADMAVWLWKILVLGTACRPYNVGSEHSISIADVAKAVASLPNTPCEVLIESRSAQGGAQNYVPDTSRARHELGVSETVAFPDALSRTWEWLQNSA